MTEPASPALLSAVRRIAALNGLTVSEGPFTVPAEPFGTLYELIEGDPIFVPAGKAGPGAFKTATQLWSGPAAAPGCAETSPEVAAIAGRGLTNPEKLTHDEIKQVCASALAQAPAAG